MRMTGFLMICCVAAMMSPEAANAGIKVSFIEPERYTDAGLHSEYGAKSRSATLTGIQQHLERLGERYLKPGQDLTIEVIDIDLAGPFELWRINARDLKSCARSPGLGSRFRSLLSKWRSGGKRRRSCN